MAVSGSLHPRLSATILAAILSDRVDRNVKTGRRPNTESFLEVKSLFVRFGEHRY